MTPAYKDTVFVATLPEIDETMAASLFDGKYTVYQIEELYRSFLIDTLSQVSRNIKARSVVHYYAASQGEMLANLFHSPIELRLIAQKEIARHHASVIERIFKTERCRYLVLLLTPHPLMDYHIMEHALHVLGIEDESLAFGTLSNCTPYLLCMKNPHQPFLMLENREYYNGDILLRTCCAIDGIVNQLCTLPELESARDLVAMKQRLEGLCESNHEYPKRSLSWLRQLIPIH